MRLLTLMESSRSKYFDGKIVEVVLVTYLQKIERMESTLGSNNQLKQRNRKNVTNRRSVDMIKSTVYKRSSQLNFMV